MLAVRLSPPSRRLMYVVCTCRKTGGTWQILKTEIGGDGQSSYGSESAVMHTATDVNYNRGYETWLLREARARDPGKPTYCLSWTVSHRSDPCAVHILSNVYEPLT